MEEEQERRNVGEKEGGQPSRNSGETGPEPKEHRIDIVENNPTVKKWNRLVQKAREKIQPQSQLPMIPKVPQILRQTQDFEKLYEPRVISLGPYHHGKAHLQPVEMIKPLCAEKFLADRNRRDIEALYTKILSKIEEVRNCYDKRPTNKYDDKKLAWMMLLDGCFLLQFICGTGMENFLRYHQINFVIQDLFLLENQLPFGVLKLIFEGASLPVEEMIKKFVISSTRRPEVSISKILLEEENKEPSHLLDLLRSALLGRYKKISKQELGSQLEQEQEAEKRESRRGLEEEMGGSVAHGKKGKQQDKGICPPEIKEKSSLCAGGDGGFFSPWKKGKQQRIGQSEKKGKSSSGGGDGGFCCPWKNGKQRDILRSFQHIKNLKAAGIYLKPSRTSFLTDISFKSYFFCRYLILPQIIIDDFTKSKFLNMVAYEMCRDAPDDYTVTSYVCFLYELIYDADDVKELRSKHILYNCLGSDEDVAQIFNEIANGLVDPDAYIGVKTSIEKHYYKRVNTWIAGGLQEYFRYPWSFTGFIAAVWILILTSLQTYYAHPGKQMMFIYMGLFGVPIFLLVVWYIVRLLWD